MFRYLPEAGGLVFRGFLLSLSRRSQEALTKALEYVQSPFLPRVIRFAGASKMLIDKLRTTEKGQKEVWRMEETKRGSLKWGLKVLAHASRLGRRCLCLCKPPLIRLRLYGRTYVGGPWADVSTSPDYMLASGASDPLQLAQILFL